MNIRTNGSTRGLPDPPLPVALTFLREAIERGERPQSTGKMIVDVRDVRSAVRALDTLYEGPQTWPAGDDDLEPDPDEHIDDDPASRDQPDPDDRTWAESGR